MAAQGPTMDRDGMPTLRRRCVIVGGGPAGMMLGLLLARAGVAVSVLEKHADFLRDFRGDTVHPSTLMILDQIGLLEKFQALRPQRVDHVGGIVGGRVQQLIDLRGLRPFPYLALVPQWDFLDLLAREARLYPRFELRMQHEVTGVVRRDGRVVGVEAKTPEGQVAIEADLVVACDGRHSAVRHALDLRALDLGAPMDVLWFRLPRGNGDPADTFGTIEAGHMMVLINRREYWQIAYLVPKGGIGRLRRQPIDALHAEVARLVPFLAGRVGGLHDWEEVKSLEVRVDRLQRWHLPGLLLIGDAAHAMSPIGGVGINLAIQDAVAAANVLAGPLRGNEPVGEALLAAIQKRRMAPTKLVQAVQLKIQDKVISRALAQSGSPLRVPAWLRFLLRFRTIRRVPARLFGYGWRRESVQAGQNLFP